MIELVQKEICNLSKLPISVTANPCYVTVVQILRNPDIKVQDTALSKWYSWTSQFSDRSLSDFYGLGIKPLQEVSHTSIFLPWIHSKPVKQFSDSAFLHVSSEEQVKKQVDKLRDLVSSFQVNGYVPKRFIDKRNGHVSGYYLEFQGQKKFYVVSGNHRVSTFFALWPTEKIPAQYEKYEFMKPRDLVNNGAIKDKKFPIVFSDSKIESWPSVKSGFLSAEDAASVLKVYFK